MTEGKEYIRRTGDMRLKVAPDLLLRVEAMAKTYGMPPATLAAFALAEWITQKENAVSHSRLAVMDMGRKAGGALEEMLSKIAEDPELQAMALRQGFSALSQPNLPLDGEAPKGSEA